MDFSSESFVKAMNPSRGFIQASLKKKNLSQLQDRNIIQVAGRSNVAAFCKNVTFRFNQRDNKQIIEVTDLYFRETFTLNGSGIYPDLGIVLKAALVTFRHIPRDKCQTVYENSG